MAHKKAAWSAKNLRDSKPKYRGVKVFWWWTVSAWNIIIRQKWNKYEAGKNTYLAKDFSIHSNIEWVVEFVKANKTRFDNRRYLKTIVNVVVPAVKDEQKKPTSKAEEKKLEKKPTKKATTKKATTKKVEKKPTTKKVATKKTTTKKPTTKKVATKKVTTKKAVTKKPSTAKKTTTKKATTK